MDHLSAAGSSATRNLTTTEPPKSLNRRKTVNFRFQRPHATSGSFFFNKPMRAMDSRRDFTSKKLFPGYFSELSEKANPGLQATVASDPRRPNKQNKKRFFWQIRTPQDPPPPRNVVWVGRLGGGLAVILIGAPKMANFCKS